MSFIETNGELTGPYPTQFKVDSFSKDRLELMVRFKKLWSSLGFVGCVSPDEVEQGQSTVPRMVGETEGVAVVNRR